MNKVHMSLEKLYSIVDKNVKTHAIITETTTEKGMRLSCGLAMVIAGWSNEDIEFVSSLLQEAKGDDLKLVAGIIANAKEMANA